jgi:hypothetical protein
MSTMQWRYLGRPHLTISGFLMTGTLDLRGNALSGSLEPFCSVIPVLGVDGEFSADCLVDTVTCSCCTVCCEEDGSNCIEF